MVHPVSGKPTGRKAKRSVTVALIKPSWRRAHENLVLKQSGALAPGNTAQCSCLIQLHTHRHRDITHSHTHTCWSNLLKCKESRACGRV